VPPLAKVTPPLGNLRIEAPGVTVTPLAPLSTNKELIVLLLDRTSLEDNLTLSVRTGPWRGWSCSL